MKHLTLALSSLCVPVAAGAQDPPAGFGSPGLHSPGLAGGVLRSSLATSNTIFLGVTVIELHLAGSGALAELRLRQPSR